jgi:hypothetical protein
MLGHKASKLRINQGIIPEDFHAQGDALVEFGQPERRDKRCSCDTESQTCFVALLCMICGPQMSAVAVPGIITPTSGMPGAVRHDRSGQCVLYLEY